MPSESSPASVAPRGHRGYVTANGVRLSYLDYGEGDPAVIIVPGITSPAATWDFVAVELADKRRVVVLDVRGRGYSDKPEEGYTLPSYAADVSALAEELSLEKPVVLGHSMGARIAAALGALEPDMAGGLIVVDPPLTGPGRDPYPTSVEDFKQQLAEGYRGTSVDEIRRFYPRWSERELQIRCDWLPSCDAYAVVETHRNFDAEDLFVYWSQLKGPTLFIYGEQSPAVTAAGVADIREANPLAEIVGISAAAHMIPWENFADFISAVETFLASR